MNFVITSTDNEVVFLVNPESLRYMVILRCAIYQQLADRKPIILDLRRAGAGYQDVRLLLEPIVPKAALMAVPIGLRGIRTGSVRRLEADFRRMIDPRIDLFEDGSGDIHD